MLSSSTKNTILQMLLGKTSSTSIASTCYLGILTGDPTNGGAEPQRTLTIEGETVSTGYERTLLGKYDQSLTQKMTVSNGTAHNQDVIYLAECLAHDDIAGYPEFPWGECTYFGLYTASSGGSPIAWGQLLNSAGTPTSIKPTKNQIPVIRKNQLEITIE